MNSVFLHLVNQHNHVFEVWADRFAHFSSQEQGNDAQSDYIRWSDLIFG